MARPANAMSADEFAKAKKVSPLELEMELQIKAAKLPVPAREYRFVPERRWRLDFAWPRYRLALEVDGGIWIQGRHSRGSGIENDLEKQNEAVVRGWHLLRVTGKMIQNGSAIAFIERGFMAVRFWPRVELPEEPNDCWQWTGALNGQGYGLVSFASHHSLAHRTSLYLHGEVLDPALTIDHLCRNRACVNPRHLEQCSRGENSRRAHFSELCQKGHVKKRTPTGQGWCPECQQMNYESKKDPERGSGWHLWGKHREACPAGHAYNDENTRWRIRNGRPSQECRVCIRFQRKPKKRKSIAARLCDQCKKMFQPRTITTRFCQEKCHDTWWVEARKARRQVVAV